jgi:hypothetical protein
MAKVTRVEAAIAYVFRNDVDFLMLSARGTVPDSGWTHPQLNERIYVNPPADGIWEFDFDAQPSGGVTMPVISPLASSVRRRVPDWFKGVRIYAATNQIEPEIVPGEPTP